MTPPCLIYGSETWTLRRTDDRRFEGAEIRWDKERGDEIRSELRMRKLDKEVPERKKNCWNIYRGFHQKELSSNCYYQPRGRCNRRI
jgi:hypothetical protein